jgi:RimJ/RimL family protein N-acetyltransferase
MNKLYLRSLQANIASQKVAEKTGFIKEGVLRKEFKSGNNQLEDVIYYGLVK